MALQSKILLFLVFSIVVVELLIYGFYRVFILSSFEELERDSAIRDLNRTTDAIGNEIKHLSTTVNDWASWDDTYKFVQDSNPEYIASNLTQEAFVIDRLNIIHIGNLNGETIWSKFYSQSTGFRKSLHPFSLKQIPSDFPLFVTQKDQAVSGLMSTDKGLVMVASRPILDSKGRGPVRGYFVMGRKMSAGYISALSSQVHLNLSLLESGQNVSSEYFNMLRDRILAQGAPHIKIENREQLTCYGLLSDIYGMPRFIVKVELPRLIMARGRVAHKFAVISIISTGVVLLVLIALLMHVVVMAPLRRLSRFVKSVKDSTSASLQLVPSSKDEIGALTSAFNKMIRRLDKSQQKKKMDSVLALAGGVAHDLNNILGPSVALPDLIIDELTGLAQKYGLSLDDVLEDLEMISSSNKRAVEVINDLSILSSMGHTSKGAIKPNAIIREVLKSQTVIVSLEQRPEISLVTDLNSRFRIWGSDGPFSRLLLNLIINGIDAIAGMGKLTVRTKDVHLDKPPFSADEFVPGQYVQLDVEDTGGGIAPEDLARIFEPFYSRKLGFARRGSGLGLAIVKGVVQEFKGHIHVDSTVGIGTCFTLLFQGIRVDKVSQMDIRDSLPPKPGKNRILVVDDESGQRRLASRILKNAGYVVETSSDGQTAVSRFANGELFNVVVLDMTMKENFDGLDTYRAILKYSPDSKVIIASGYTPTKRGNEALSMGAKWLSKPYDRDSLLLALDDILLSRP